MKKILIAIVVIIIAVYFVLQKQDAGIAQDFKNAAFNINGILVTLKDGVAETDIGTSSSKTVTRYFGNELKTDLDADGDEDSAFILTQTQGGSGTFYYAVAALNTEKGYVGSDGYLLGDRIAPQTIDISPNPRHKNVIVVNYSDRKAGEPMTATPSVGKSAYLKLDRESMLWGIVLPDFEGESR